MNEPFSADIAIIGLSCRFPGADNSRTFWDNLINGIESIQRFTKEELKASGTPEELLNNPNYISAKGIVNGVEWFDADFFGFNPFDAKITDPQQRLFLECAWEALESAGYPSGKSTSTMGVYASMADSTYLQNNLLKNKEVYSSFDWFQARISTSIGSLSTQVSYRLNLTGPSINLSTACSSSLVSIIAACKGLIDYDCDIAVAGASSIDVPQKQGYLYQEGGIRSPDGHCKPFDVNAKGTVFSNGLGVVILKRLENAIQDGDFIYGVIKGWNINNDGSDKLGFSAPSVNGQANCVAAALNFADVNPKSISYVEAHGTATELGDVIELEALTKAFGLEGNEKQYCALGSVKSNIGHIDIAAGIASVIKTTLALKNKVIPASLHYKQPNPNIDFINTPFYVNSNLEQWDTKLLPRRAGINSSGIGGTNAFLILEEFTKSKIKSSSRPCQLLLISAKTKTALEKSTENLIQFLKQNPEENIADIAFTLKIGRVDFNYRNSVICENVESAILSLQDILKTSLDKKPKINDNPKIVFMFSGQGSQYKGMANDLYIKEPEFSKWVDHCCHLNPFVKKAIDIFLFQDNFKEDINNTLIAQPALFVIEYALARVLMNLGIEPDALIGHSIGEYTAACLAGTLELEAALQLICCRAELMTKTNSGAMIAVELEEEKLLPLLKNENVSIAAINSFTNHVISGELKSIETLEEKLNQQGILSRRLKTSHAFHSNMMEPILNDFYKAFESVELRVPHIPFISNLTGDWISKKEVINSDYWVQHLRQTVRFSDGLKTLQKEGYNIFIEIGPGRTLTNFAKQLLIKDDATILVQNSLPTIKEDVSDQTCFLTLLGQLWQWGVKINWDNFYQHEKRYRIPLPTYPFERKKYWIEPNITDENLVLDHKKPYQKWFYEPSWERTSIQDSRELFSDIFKDKYCWIVFLDNEKVGDTIFDILSNNNQLVIKIKSGENFKKQNADEYSICISEKNDYVRLIEELLLMTTLPFQLINLFPITLEHNMEELDLSEVEKTVNLSFYTTLFLTQALLETQYDKKTNILIVGNEIFSILGTENVYPAKSTAVGPCHVIPKEHPSFKIKLLDLLLSDLLEESKRLMICRQIIKDSIFEDYGKGENIFAYRNNFCWNQTFYPLKFTPNTAFKLKFKGVYLFTGGLGGISLTIAKHIAETSKNPQLILLSRSHFPDQKEWKAWIEKNGSSDRISRKILSLQEIVNLGAEVFVLRSDISNLDECKQSIQKLREKFGSFNGVVHAAGIAGGGVAQLKTVEMANKVFNPKVKGTYILTHLLREEPLDFFILCSSISSVVGESSQVDYCSANACLDAFVFTRTFKKASCVVINWNTWRDVGMAIETEKPMDITNFDRNNNISPAEGARIFADVLGNKYRQAIVSTYDINSLIRLIKKDNYASNTNDLWLEEKSDFTHTEQEEVLANNTEIELLKIWKVVLGLNKIGLRDDFISLGGHSLMALRLLSFVEQKFNVKISLQAFQKAKTIEVLAKQIDTLRLSKKKIPSSIISIRTEGNRMPLFCFHPVGGNVLCYMGLSKHLKFDCPIYGIQDPSFEQEKLLYDTLEEMATSYLSAIKEIQKEGPYLLCGLSFGATLAVEVARQLRKNKEKVMPLILFDGWAKLFEHQYEEKTFKESMKIKTNSSFSKNFVNLSFKRMNILRNYKVSMIEDKLILFKAKKLLPEYIDIDDPNNYWDNYAIGGLETYIVPGDHESILDEPNVIVLAKKLDSIFAIRQKEFEHVEA